MDRLNQLISLLPNNLVGGSVCIYTATHLLTTIHVLIIYHFHSNTETLILKIFIFLKKFIGIKKTF